MNKNNVTQSDTVMRNRVIARGKIVELKSRTLTLFIRKGAGRKHTYLTFHYDEPLPQVFKGDKVIILGHLENKEEEGRISQYYKIDDVQKDSTELSQYFQTKEQLGFASPKPFTKFFVYGKVRQIYSNDWSNWVEVIVEDRSGISIKLQYSLNMRVSDISISVGDNIYLYALPISTTKLFDDEEVRFEILIVEDMAIQYKTQ